MDLLAFGLNHQSAPLEVRERLAIPEDRWLEFLSHGIALPDLEEVFALSTCNRVEIYGASYASPKAREQILEWLSGFHRCDPALFEPHMYFYEGEAAIRHGFRVASGLDSMIVGEPQILGQMKAAYQRATDARTIGKLLHKFLHRAFYVAKKLRSETSLGSQPVSISYAAVLLAKQIFGDLSQKKILIVGAGKMSTLAARHFKTLGVEKIFISNRNTERAAHLSQALGGETIPFDKFEKWLVDADIVVTSTASPDYLINLSKAQEAMKQRKNRPMFFIDIAVPRNIAPEVNRLPNVYLYDIDELGEIIQTNKAERLKQAEQATSLLEQEVSSFVGLLRTFNVAPTLSSLSKKFDQICQQELEKTFQRLPQLDAEQRKKVEEMAYAIINKILHDPMIVLKEKSLTATRLEPLEYTAFIRTLFRLDEDSSP